MAWEDLDNFCSFDIKIDVDGHSIEEALCLELGEVIRAECVVADEGHINSAIADTNRVNWGVDDVYDTEVTGDKFTATMSVYGSEDRSDDVMWAGDTVIAKISGTWKQEGDKYLVTFQVDHAEIEDPNEREQNR